MSADRYYLGYDSMDRHPDGDYVRHDDYEEIEAKLAKPEHLNVFKLMGILNSIPPMTPDVMWIRPDIAPDRIVVNYEFSVSKFPHERWSYQFVIRDDWTESYLMRNAEVIKKQIRDGMAVFVSELMDGGKTI